MSKQVISGLGIEFLKEREGFSPKIKDDCGHPMIGYGCDLSPDEAKIWEGKTITSANAVLMMLYRLNPIEECINRFVKVPLTQNQFDALCSLAYNIGEPRFLHSTLLKYLNLKMFQEAADEFLEWDKAGGKVDRGLQVRRKLERDLFLDLNSLQKT